MALGLGSTRLGCSAEARPSALFASAFELSLERGVHREVRGLVARAQLTKPDGCVAVAHGTVGVYLEYGDPGLPQRSQGKFVMAIVGHPRIAGGYDIPPTAEGGNVSESTDNFAALYQLLAKHNVRIAMAGDTHDFEYYKERMGSAAMPK